MNKATGSRQLRERSVDGESRYFPALMWHLYAKLNLKKKFECAQTKEDAKRYLEAVSKAAMASQGVLENEDGVLLEVQGSMIHLGVESPIFDPSVVISIANDLNTAFEGLFPGRSCVDNWSMAADWGGTIVVEGRGIHGDSSLVSLGNPANRPAKKIYSVDNKPDSYCLALPVSENSPSWYEIPLEKLSGRELVANRAYVLGSQARQADVAMEAIVHAQAAPISSPSGEPTSADPLTKFGWVVRADLDGFTKKVAECYRDPIKAQKLAVQFAEIMDRSADFANQHEKFIIQLPWAGDNFTAAIVYSDKVEYEQEKKEGLVSFSLDWDDYMHNSAINADFGGWAQGVAGGNVHGNSQGNVHIAKVTCGNRDFVIGAGEGTGRSFDAFAHVNPKPQEVTLYEDDRTDIHTIYQQVFRPTESSNGGISTLFRIATKEELVDAKQDVQSTSAKSFSVTGPGNQRREITTRPYFNGK